MNFKGAGGNGCFDDGAGVLVIYDDGSSPAAEIQILDGHDFSALVDFIPEPEKSSTPVTFNFAPAGSDRMANLALFVGDAEASRPDRITVDVPGAPLITIDNSLVAADGPQWDTMTIGVPIPAGASSMTVNAGSFDDGVGLPDSVNWLCGALSVPGEPVVGEGCSPGYWKRHTEVWFCLLCDCPSGECDQLLADLNTHGRGSEAIRNAAADLLNQRAIAIFGALPCEDDD